LSLAFTLLGLLLTLGLLSKYLPALLYAYHLVRSVTSCHSIECLAGTGGSLNVTVVDAFVARGPWGDAIVVYACSSVPAVFRVYVGGSYAGVATLPYNPIPDLDVCEKVALVVVKHGASYTVLLEPVEHGDLRGLYEVLESVAGLSPGDRIEAPVRLTLVTRNHSFVIRVERVVTLGRR